jgi:hypothetical protein
MDEAITGERGDAPRLGWLKALMLLLAAVVVTHSVTFAIGGLPGVSGRVGSEIASAADTDDRTAPAGFLRVKQVKADGQLASAGVRAGDAIRFEHPWDLYRLSLPERQTFHLTILRDGRLIPTSFVTRESRPRGWEAEVLITTFTSLFMAGAGVVISLRGRTRGGVLLGASLVAMAHIGSYVMGWENDLVRNFPVAVLLGTVLTLAPVGIFAFALLQRAEANGRRVSRFWGTLFWLYVAVSAADFINASYAVFAITSPPLRYPQIVSILVYWGGSAAALVLLIRAAFETTGQARTRFGFLAAALGSYFGGTAVTGAIINLTGNDFSLSNPVAVLGQFLALSGIAIFLYAALKHRVVDLGFAVNRTLVFGALSTTLLFAFFFLEWGAEQVIPAHMREANLLASAGIALVLFLLFHKARDWVEKAVESLFFKSWRDIEARLDRFLKDAAYVSRAETLTEAALVALARYTGGAAVALYRVDEAGADRVGAAGDGLPERLDADDPVMVRLRAEREPLDGGLPDAVGAALALPMVQRADIRGLILIGPKPSGEDYRPDERDILARAAQGVGMDLHALEIERLERRVETLDAQLSLALSPKRRVGGRAGSMA